MAKNKKKTSRKAGKSMSRRDLDRLKNNNPNVLRERYVDKKKRLKDEEDRKLDNATVKKGSFGWKKSESFIEGTFEVINEEEG